MCEWLRTRAKGVRLLSIAALLLTGCSEASRQRWNDFWGLNEGGRRPVVRAENPDQPAEPDKKREVARARPTPPGEAEPPLSVNIDRGDPRAIDHYVSDMESRGIQEYRIYDHMDKVRRQQDPDRHGRIQRAAANTVEGEPAVQERPVEGISQPPARASSGEPAPTGPTSPVRVASTETRSKIPIPTESAPNRPPSDTIHAEGAGPSTPERPEEGAAGISIPSDREEAVPDRPMGPPSSPTPKVEKPGQPPVLSKIEIAPAPEPKQAPQVDSESPPAEKSGGTRPNMTPAQLEPPPDTYALRLKKQEQIAAKDPNDIETQYRLRMMYLIDGRDEKALAPIEGIHADIQEIIQAQIKALIAARSSAGRDPAEWANRQLASIEELRRRVRARADLTIPTVALCTAIEGFGLYDPIEPAEFIAGRNNRVIIYIEVDNFSSRKTTSGFYRTLLSVRQSLLSAAGEEIWSNRDENIEDLARQRRRDFYLSSKEPIQIPKTLPPGRYTLKVEVEDVLAGKINSGHTEFKIIP